MKKLDSGINYVRYAIGELHVVALRDGHVDMPASRLRQAGGRRFGSDLPAQVELVDGRLRLSVNAFLVIGHGEHILVDTGAATSSCRIRSKAMLGNRKYCYPLTITDYCSRYLLACESCVDQIHFRLQRL
jgi:hypothetical protein